MNKIIHQSYKTDDLNGTPFRSIWKESWLKENPTWERRFWSDEDTESFIAEEYPEFYRDVWLEYDVNIKKWDSARTLILKRIGGVYADMDFACLKPLDDLVKNLGNKFLITTEGDIGNPQTLGNSFMACEPNCPFLDTIEEDFKKARFKHVLSSSACGFMTKRAKETGRGNQIYSPKSEWIFPLWWQDPRKPKYFNMPLEEIKKDFPESFAISFFTGSWLNQY